jgi:hypothetical protein
MFIGFGTVVRLQSRSGPARMREVLKYSLPASTLPL